MNETPYKLAEMDRQMGNVIRIGKVCEADHANARWKIMIDGAPSGWLPMLTTRAGKDRSWWGFEEGEQVCVFAPSGNPSNGVIMGAAYSEAHAPNGSSPDIHRIDYENGSFIEHNRATGKFTINATGDIDIIAGGNVRINGAKVDLN